MLVAVLSIDVIIRFACAHLPVLDAIIRLAHITLVAKQDPSRIRRVLILTGFPFVW